MAQTLYTYNGSDFIAQPIGPEDIAYSSFTTTQATTEGWYRVASVPLSSTKRNLIVRAVATSTGGSYVGTATDTTIYINFPYNAAQAGSQAVGLGGLTGHTYNSWTSGEQGYVLLYARVSYDATTAYLDFYKYKSVTTSIVCYPMNDSEWTFLTGAQSVNPTVGSVRSHQIDLRTGYVSNGGYSSGAGSATYCEYGILGGNTGFNHATDYTNHWAYIGYFTMDYSSSYLEGRSGQYDIGFQELSMDGSKTVSTLENFIAHIKINLATHTDAATFNTTVPTYSIELEGNTTRGSSDMAILVTATSTSQKILKVYIKLLAAQQYYQIYTLNRYGRSFNNATTSTTSYAPIWIYRTAEVPITPLPTPAQGSIAYATKYLPAGTAAEITTGTETALRNWAPDVLKSAIQSLSDLDTNWYPTTFAWTGGTTAGPTGSLTGTGMSAVSYAAIPSAGTGASGIVTTGAQAFAGAKTFNANTAIYQAMTDGTNAFTTPHLALQTSNTVDNTGYVGMTFATSSSANYGFSLGALRTTNGSGDLVVRFHSASTSGTEVFKIGPTGTITATTFVGALTGTASGNLTSTSTLDASKLSGTIPSGVLGNSTVYIGTTAVALNRASATLALTGVTNTNWDAAYTHSTTTTGAVHGATTVGNSFFRLTNPSAISFPRINADNTVTALDAASFRTAIGAGTGSGSVTSVAMTVPTGLSISGSPITTSGTLALSLASGYAIPTTSSAGNWDTAYTHSQNTTTAVHGATTLGYNLLKLANPSAIRFPRFNADNTVSALSATDTLTALGAAPASHAHGDITTDGKVTTSSITIENTDRILVTDTSASGVVKNGPTFGTGTTTFLRNDGTWAAPTATTMLTSIKDFSTYLATNGITPVAIATTESIVSGNIYGLEFMDTTSSGYTRQIVFVKIYTGSACVTPIYTYSASSSTTTIYKVETYHTDGVLYLDDAYTQIHNDTAAEADPIATTTALLLWNVYKVN